MDSLRQSDGLGSCDRECEILDAGALRGHLGDLCVRQRAASIGAEIDDPQEAVSASQQRIGAISLRHLAPVGACSADTSPVITGPQCR